MSSALSSQEDHSSFPNSLPPPPNQKQPFHLAALGSDKRCAQGLLPHTALLHSHFLCVKTGAAAVKVQAVGFHSPWHWVQGVQGPPGATTRCPSPHSSPSGRAACTELRVGSSSCRLHTRKRNTQLPFFLLRQKRKCQNHRDKMHPSPGKHHSSLHRPETAQRWWCPHIHPGTTIPG